MTKSSEPKQSSSANPESASNSSAKPNSGRKKLIYAVVGCVVVLLLCCVGTIAASAYGTQQLAKSAEELRQKDLAEREALLKKEQEEEAAKVKAEEDRFNNPNPKGQLLKTGDFDWTVVSASNRGQKIKPVYVYPGSKDCDAGAGNVFFLVEYKMTYRGKEGISAFSGPVLLDSKKNAYKSDLIDLTACVRSIEPYTVPLIVNPGVEYKFSLYYKIPASAVPGLKAQLSESSLTSYGQAAKENVYVAL